MIRGLRLSRRRESISAAGDSSPGTTGRGRITAPSRWLLLATALSLVTAIGLVAPMSAFAVSPPLAPVSVALAPPPAASIGSEVLMAGTIRRGDGLAPTGLRVALYVNNRFDSSAHADDRGRLSFRLNGPAISTAGSFAIEARFEGAHGLAPARAARTLTLRPAVVTITTVPAVGGVPVSVGKATATTGADGIATIKVSKVGVVALVASPEQLVTESVRVSFARWGDQVFDLSRNIDVRGDATYVLGLRTAYQASVHFVDADGVPVDPTTINRARFTSSTGGELVLTSYDNAWWEAGTAVSRTGGLQPSTTLWRLRDVEISGTNAVYQGQQAFTPTVKGSFTVSLLLYDVTVRTEDALTGSSVGGTAELVLPDESSRSGTLVDGVVHFGGLPRGSYVVKLKTDGISPQTPVALSRSQEVKIRVVSAFDLWAGAGLVVAILVVLLYIGRRRHFWLFARASALARATVGHLPFESASVAIRRVPEAGRTLTTVRSDLAQVDRGRGAAAFAFLGTALTRLGRVVLELAALVPKAARRLVRAVLQRRASATSGSDGRDPARGQGPGVRPRPAWQPSTGSEVLPTIHPRMTAASRPPASQQQDARRPIGAADGWFKPEAEAEGEDDGPTHECQRCHRQIPDDANFCRMCGYPQT